MIRTFCAVAAALSCSLATAQPRVELLPPGATAQAPLPLVIALHGRGGDARAFAGFVRRLVPHARIISLQAPTPMGEGFTWLQTRVAHKDAARVTREVRRALEALRPRLREVVKSAPACGQPVIVGFSQGGVLALALAAERFQGMAAFVDIAGALPARYPVARSGGPARVISLHGREDDTVPLSATRRALAALRQAGVEVRSVELAGGHASTEALRTQARQLIAEVLGEQCPAERRYLSQ